MSEEKQSSSAKASEDKEEKYNHEAIEEKWQKIWQEKGLHKTEDKGKGDKFYCLDMFPYPSGEGLHVGHMRGYTFSDVIARKKKMEKNNVLHPMGFDAFGLPAENYAIKNNISPQESTKNNIASFRRDLNRAGFMYDWDREIVTCNYDYYKWTQWLFVQLYKKGLAYRKQAPINWCTGCKASLADEEVVDGRCERCGSEVVKKMLTQWFFKITDYADRLLEDLDLLDWPERVKTMQKNWIGRSYGTEFSMEVFYAGKRKLKAEATKNISPDFIQTSSLEDSVKIKVFTTRIDTAFGITYVVLSPEHPLVPFLITPDQEKEVQDYIEKTRRLSEIERKNQEREKTGVFTGSYAVNPVNGSKVPIWIADYVLLEYGTGAIMAVPAHDKRDFDFAEKYGLDIVEVISPEDGQSTIEKGAFVEDGVLVNSGQFSGLSSERAREEITRWLEEQGISHGTKNYHLRDWLISRQRYWGAPIPIVYCEKCGEVVVPEDQLPVLLPEVEDYQPTGTGDSPLAGVEDFVNTVCPKCGGPAKRETDVISQWVCSSWYFTRYIDSKNDKEIFDKKKVKKWLPVDLYVGGIEHAILHLLYARFMTKFMFDIGLIEFEEPFLKLFNQGMIYYKGEKMSKSKGNVVGLEEFFKNYGADTMRVYELFVGPAEQDVEWNDRGVVGVYRFLEKVWDIVIKSQKTDSPDSDRENESIEKLCHITIKKVTEDCDNFKFNTAVSSLMEYVNKLRESFLNDSNISHTYVETLVNLLAPMAPHICEELWEKLGHKESVFQEDWPEYNPDLVIEEKVELVVQVNGKVRDKVEIEINLSEEEVKKIVLGREKVKKYVEGKEIKKVVYVYGKLMNIVVE